MSNKLDWVAFLDCLPGNPTDRAIAKSIWRDGQAPKPKQAADIARHFGLHPLNGLVAAGYLTLDDVDELFSGKQAIEVAAIDDMSSVEIAEHLVARLRNESGTE